MRQDGFYWVKIYGRWIIGEYITESWYFCDPMLDSPGGHLDEDLEQIDAIPIKRTIEIKGSDLVAVLKNKSRNS